MHSSLCWRKRNPLWLSQTTSDLLPDRKRNLPWLSQTTSDLLPDRKRNLPWPSQTTSDLLPDQLHLRCLRTFLCQHSPPRARPRIPFHFDLSWVEWLCLLFRSCYYFEALSMEVLCSIRLGVRVEERMARWDRIVLL